MDYRHRYVRTVVLITAVLLPAVLLSGCCTKRDIEEVKARLARVESNQQAATDLVARMDSLINSGAQADNQLRNELRYSVDALSEQMASLLANYTDLMQRVEMLMSQQQQGPVVTRLQSSQGAQQDVPPPVVTDTDTVAPAAPAINCDSTYDDSFIHMRRSEYDTAIEGFLRFLESCPGHENISNAHYWIGECYYAVQKFNEAIEHFETLVKDFSNSPKIGQALYKIARSKEEQGKLGEAKTIFQQVIDEHPGTLEAEQAKQRLKDL